MYQSGLDYKTETTQELNQELLSTKQRIGVIRDGLVKSKENCSEPWLPGSGVNAGGIAGYPHSGICWESAL